MATDALWTIYYPDGSTFSSLDGTPESSPVRCVACIGSKVSEGTLFGHEYYYWKVDEWWPSDTQGLLYQLLNDTTGSSVRAIRKGAYFQPDPHLQRMIWRAFVDRMP